MNTAAVGISAHMGWVAAVTVAPAGRRIRVIRSDRLPTCRADDREAQEPYHVAGGYHALTRVVPPRQPAQIIERGLARQSAVTLESFRAHAHALEACGYRLDLGAILTGRSRLGRSLERVLASHAQIHVAEGLAVRQSVESALTTLRIRVVAIDQKSLWPMASKLLGASEAELLATLKALRPETPGTWRQEQRLCALGAWVALRQV